MTTAYDALIDRIREAHLIQGTYSVLSWDQEVLMPTGGMDYRSRQMALLARLAHERITAPEVGDLLARSEVEVKGLAPTAVPAVNVRELRRKYDRERRLPASLVEEEARLASLGQVTWREARKNSDFAHFRPVLERIVDLLRRKAECYGWPEGGEPWDALAEDYEPGCTAKDVAAVFTPLRDRLRALLEDLLGRGTPPSHAFNETAFPIESQKAFGRFVAEAIGFDFGRGRLDVSTHPFCSGNHPGDVRLTSRYRDVEALDALSSTMHECGHGIYEQGLLSEHVGTPMGDSVSLGIHESQSRMWENQVGRSLAFWRWCRPHAQRILGDALGRFSVEDIYGAANVVQPSLIRVEADEATYNMHIFVRFELERAILRGDLAVADIPDAWNAKYREYLGIEVPDDARGCLQDIHWSMTSMGYFPTYTLGNLYSAQFFEKACADVPDMERRFEKGDFGALRHWLHVNIHAHGRRYRAAELCEKVTGKPLSADPLLRHLEGKLKPLYGI